MPNGRLANPAETKRGHGDAELAAREIGFDVAHHSHQETGAEAVLLGHGFDAKPAALHQREFSRHVECVGSEQKDGDEQIDGR